MYDVQTYQILDEIIVGEMAREDFLEYLVKIVEKETKGITIDELAASKDK